MYKLLLTFLLSSGLSFAGIVNGIALTVNDAPITLFDIDQTIVSQNVDKNQAVGLLVDKILYEQLIEKNNIKADVFDVNDYIEKLAASNNMDLFAFKSIIRQKYPDYSKFENEAKQVVTRQKLIATVVKGKLKIASDEDMKLYYDNHQEKYSTAKTVEVVEYTSKKKASLIAVVKSPLTMPTDVNRSPLVLQTQEINPQMQYLLNNTQQNAFTPIFTANKMYTMLFIIKKEGVATLDFNGVKTKVFIEVMALREKKFLKNFFEKQKLTADIKILR
jgi:parvulin-like peptidyl-prolyl isomerase